MAGKAELSATTGVQNVVVYVSDGNFAQAYAVGQQNVGPFTTQSSQPAIHPGPTAGTMVPHSMAAVVASSKTHYPTNNGQIVSGPPGYFTNPQAVISQNGFPGSLVGYQNVNVNPEAVLSGKNIANYDGNHKGEARAEFKVRDDSDNREGYTSADSGYVSVIGGEAGTPQNRCDSVRSETAESSCSSLSSTDDGLVVVQQPSGSEMVVYDGGAVGVRAPGGMVLAVGAHGAPPQAPQATLVRNVAGPQPNTVMVPFRWKRILNNGSIVYIR